MKAGIGNIVHREGPKGFTFQDEKRLVISCPFKTGFEVYLSRL